MSPQIKPCNECNNNKLPEHMHIYNTVIDHKCRIFVIFYGWVIAANIPKYKCGVYAVSKTILSYVRQHYVMDICPPCV